MVRVLICKDEQETNPGDQMCGQNDNATGAGGGGGGYVYRDKGTFSVSYLLALQRNKAPMGVTINILCVHKFGLQFIANGAAAPSFVS